MKIQVNDLEFDSEKDDIGIIMTKRSEMELFLDGLNNLLNVDDDDVRLGVLCTTGKNNKIFFKKIEDKYFQPKKKENEG